MLRLQVKLSTPNEFKICFLGTGTSHGIPVIGCQCSVCLSSDLRDKRLRTSIYIQTPECAFVVDTTPDFRQQCLRENILQLDAVVYTHSHTDHILGFDDLRRFCEMEDKQMPIYAAADTMADLRRVFTYAFEGPIYKNYIRPDPHIINGVFFLGETEIIPLRLPHGRLILNGYLFQRHGRKLLAYMTDCHEVPLNVIEQVRGCEILVVDALRYSSHSTHMTVEQALEASKKIQPEKTYFIHMCHDLGHIATEQQLPDNVFLSYDQLQLNLTL